MLRRWIGIAVVLAALATLAPQVFAPAVAGADDPPPDIEITVIGTPDEPVAAPPPGPSLSNPSLPEPPPAPAPINPGVPDGFALTDADVDGLLAAAGRVDCGGGFVIEADQAETLRDELVANGVVAAEQRSAVDLCGFFEVTIEPVGEAGNKEVKPEQQRFSSRDWGVTAQGDVCGTFSWLYTIENRWTVGGVPLTWGSSQAGYDRVGTVAVEQRICVDPTYRILFNGTRPPNTAPSTNPSGGAALPPQSAVLFTDPDVTQRPQVSVRPNNDFGFPYSLTLAPAAAGATAGVTAQEYIASAVAGTGDALAPYAGWQTRVGVILTAGGVNLSAGGPGGFAGGGVSGSGEAVIITLDLITVDTVRQEACRDAGVASSSYAPHFCR